MNSVTDTVKGAVDTTSKEANKSTFHYTRTQGLLTINPRSIDVAKDSNAGVGTRAEAAKDAAGDKANEMKHTVCSRGIFLCVNER